MSCIRVHNSSQVVIFMLITIIVWVSFKLFTFFSYTNSETVFAKTLGAASRFALSDGLMFNVWLNIFLLRHCIVDTYITINIVCCALNMWLHCYFQLQCSSNVFSSWDSITSISVNVKVHPWHSCSHTNGICQYSFLWWFVSSILFSSYMNGTKEFGLELEVLHFHQHRNDYRLVQVVQEENIPVKISPQSSLTHKADSDGKSNIFTGDVRVY